MLYNLLVAKLRGEAFNIVSSVRDGSGYEAWRLIMKRYEPRTPGTKRALLKTIFNMKPAKKVEEIEKNVLRLEEIFNRYEVMSKEALAEDIKTVIMIELCTPELKEHLEFNIKDVSYKETREAIMAYVERKRRDPITAMEVGNHEYEDHIDWWGTSANEYTHQDEEELNYNGYSWKGKGPYSGPSWKGKGKGPSKGTPKGTPYSKGFGKDKGGKGKGKKGGFQGDCHWCGKWGHTASRCPEKDGYMEWIRSGKGFGKDQQQETNQLQQDHPEPWQVKGNPVAALDTPGRFVDICNVVKHFPKLHNRFSVLGEDDQEEMFQAAKARRWEKKRCDISSVEPASSKKRELNHLSADDFMELTIDSGAGENVMPAYLAPNTPIRHSPEQDAGVVYTAANGETMPNRGRKVVRVTTQEGQQKAMNMQVTDVNRALMSVARICDAGHTVLFKSDGGIIRNNTSGEETSFRRENNVYRMTVKVNEADFARQD